MTTDDRNSSPYLDELHREFIRAGEAHAPRFSRRPPSLYAAALIGALLIAIGAVTPAGSAAANWLVDAVGFGSDPSLPQPQEEHGSSVVLDQGSLDDGTPYELVAGHLDPQTFPARFESDIAAAHFDVCFQVDWPTLTEQGAGGLCTAASQSDREGRPIMDDGRISPPGEGSGSSQIYFGVSEDPSVASVKLVRHSANGDVSSLPTKLIQLSGEPLDRAGGRDPVAVFLAVLDSDDISAVSRGDASIDVVARNAQGEELAQKDVFTENSVIRGN